MQNILSRELINPEISFIPFGVSRPKTYKQLCSRINQAKHLLLSKGVKKQELVTVVTLTQNFDTTAILFALFELGCVTHVCCDELFTEEVGNFKDTTDWRILGFDKEWRLSEMNKEVGGGYRLGDMYDGAGFQWHNAVGFCNKPLVMMDYDELDDQPTDDIQPWDVYEDDVCYLVELHGWSRYHTHKEVLKKSRDCIDIFGYRGLKVGLVKSQHHQQAFELCTLPALMSARKVFELPVPDKEPIAEFYQPITEMSCKLIQRNGVELVWGIIPEVLEWIHQNFEFENTKFVRQEGNVYGDMSSRPICLS